MPFAGNPAPNKQLEHPVKLSFQWHNNGIVQTFSHAWKLILKHKLSSNGRYPRDRGDTKTIQAIGDPPGEMWRALVGGTVVFFISLWPKFGVLRVSAYFSLDVSSIHLLGKWPGIVYTSLSLVGHIRQCIPMTDNLQCSPGPQIKTEFLRYYIGKH